MTPKCVIMAVGSALTEPPSSDNMAMMRIIYLGSGSIAQPCLTELVSGPHQLLAVLTQPDRPAGRGRKLQPTPIKLLAGRLGLKVHALDDVNAPSALQCLASLKPDLLVTFAFNQKLGHNLLKIAPKGAINVHPSLLPKYRGAAPVARAILNGDTRTGISIIKMVEDLDAGEIFVQESHDIGPHHNTGTLEEYLGQQAAPLLAKVIDQIEKGIAKPYPQDHSQASGAPKMEKDEARLDFFLPATELVNYIRAFTPWPGAFAELLGLSDGRVDGSVAGDAFKKDDLVGSQTQNVQSTVI